MFTHTCCCSPSIQDDTDQHLDQVHSLTLSPHDHSSHHTYCFLEWDPLLYLQDLLEECHDKWKGVVQILVQGGPSELCEGVFLAIVL